MSYWKSAVVSLLTGVMIASSAIQPVAIYAETVLDEGGQADSAQDGSVQADGSESDRSTSDEPVDSEAEVSRMPMRPLAVRRPIWGRAQRRRMDLP